jgi:hypothetical protein
VYRREDIITLKPGRENAWLDASVERVLQKFSCSWIRVSIKTYGLSIIRKETNWQVHSLCSVLLSAMSFLAVLRLY